MKTYALEIPEDVLLEARIPPSERDETLRKELAVHLYVRGLLPKAAARRLSGMGRIAFNDLLGQRGCPSPLGVDDLDAEMKNLEDWRNLATGEEEPS